MKALITTLLIIACINVNGQKLDTVKVMLLVCDTAKIEMGGRIKFDSGGAWHFVPYYLNNWEINWQYAYAVREFHAMPYSTFTDNGGSFIPSGWQTIYYLSPDRKTKLPDNIIVWMAK